MIKIQVDLPVALPDAFGAGSSEYEGLEVQFILPEAVGGDRYVRLEGPLQIVVKYLLDWWDLVDIPEALENAVLLFDGEDD